ncbi:hypothetical protein [Christiangramia forsetii]|uniref:Secreted protein n=2 Tax=Christiangramia forsetii TaxID=411153 RepID=A0M570_CHRFK|nr:hypothetical protein [Christiangramia forsetii]GGG21696.1 hypothetical protein GCM10011532_00920 [Christiangramia forsetii]CAL67765.1 secreted protein [Christiangramia forsetii KT0803]
MKHFLFVLALIASLNIFSQETTTNNQFSLNLLAPSAEYEFSVSDRSTIDLNLGIGFTYQYSSLFGEAYGIYPGFEAQYRYYYNFEKRADKGKKTSENSANYITGIASVTSGNAIIGDLDYENDYGAFVGPAWGLQRVYESGFKLNLNLGLGLGFNDSGDTYVKPLFSFQLGWLVAQ